MLVRWVGWRRNRGRSWRVCVWGPHCWLRFQAAGMGDAISRWQGGGKSPRSRLTGARQHLGTFSMLVPCWSSTVFFCALPGGQCMLTLAVGCRHATKATSTALLPWVRTHTAHGMRAYACTASPQPLRMPMQRPHCALGTHVCECRLLLGIIYGSSFNMSLHGRSWIGTRKQAPLLSSLGTVPCRRPCAAAGMRCAAAHAILHTGTSCTA